MKKESISTYFIVLLMLSSLLTLPAPLHAQEKKMKATDEQPEGSLFQGVYVGADVFGLMNKALGSDITSAEAIVEVHLKNRFFPVLEIGYGSFDATNDETDIYYKTSAPYFRIGMDYNVFYKKPHLPGFFTVGLRYGFTSFDYDIEAPDLVDPNWGHTVVPFSYKGVKSNSSWAELVIAMKTNVFKDFYMGFSVRYRSSLSVKKHENSEPYYIPGFGKGNSSNFGLTYNLIYKLPF